MFFSIAILPQFTTCSTRKDIVRTALSIHTSVSSLTQFRFACSLREPPTCQHHHKSPGHLARSPMKPSARIPQAFTPLALVFWASNTFPSHLVSAACSRTSRSLSPVSHQGFRVSQFIYRSTNLRCMLRRRFRAQKSIDCSGCRCLAHGAVVWTPSRLSAEHMRAYPQMSPSHLPEILECHPHTATHFLITTITRGELMQAPPPRPVLQLSCTC